MLYIVIFVTLIAAILVYAALQPDNFRVERSISIQASPDRIFPHINDFHLWKAWSPWEQIDLAAKTTHSGAINGVGAVYEWNGNNEVGQGRMEIIESEPYSKVVMKIDFIKPFAGHNTIEFNLGSADDATKVSQAMYGTSPFISKLMCLFFSMDKMVGSKYEEGLANLKAIIEK
ncbi:MAG: SRPBCC family protein [Methylotenera sp.]|uniref:SRPBCC family protein n=1 Tax=Methylotenera sp. TaxID=2051956 RepID=UPI0017917953|nr:SRPBCC family protein [Methylotenera sp.]NOU23979.1 SRPBCC family protein [Methylotenera sp.]